jgi:hypothetical protein
VTVISTVPEPAGATAVIEVALETVNDVAAVLPNLTAVAPVKDVPVMVTLDPARPAAGDTEVTTGAARYVNRSAVVAVDVPAEVVTLISTVPAARAGLVTVIWVSLSTV